MFAAFNTFIQHNPFIAGGIGVATAGWIMGNIKEAPKNIWRHIKGQLTVKLTVFSEDNFFSYLNRYLAEDPCTYKARKLAISEFWDEENEKRRSVVSPGPGTHMIWRGWRPFIVERDLDDKEGKGGDGYSRRKQTIHITTLGRKQNAIREFIASVYQHVQRCDDIPIYMWNGMEYYLMDRRQKRSFETVYCAPGIKESLLKDVQRFHSNRDWYSVRGIPYRRGYLLEGPPGTGKTTLIYAIASITEKPIFLVNPATMDNDNQLQHAFSAAKDGYLVIEDIDSISVTEDRATREKPATVGDAAKSGITLSGLLNAIDGIGSREGRVLFITSNTPEKLDPALLRAGRIDKTVHLGPADTHVAVQMFERFHPMKDQDKFLSELQAYKALPLPQAEIQNYLLSKEDLAA